MNENRTAGVNLSDLNDTLNAKKEENLDELNEVSSSETVDDQSTEQSQVKPKLFDVPLVQKLHQRNPRTDDQSLENKVVVENLHLKEPSIQNFPNTNEISNSPKLANESSVESTNELTNESTKLDQASNQTDAKPIDGLNVEIASNEQHHDVPNNQEPLVESVNESKEEPNKLDLNLTNVDLDALKESYRESTSNDASVLKLKEFDTNSNGSPSNEANQTKETNQAINEGERLAEPLNQDSKPTSTLESEQPESDKLNSPNESTENNKSENVSTNKEELDKRRENDRKVDQVANSEINNNNNEQISTVQPGEQVTESIPNLDNFVTPPNVHLHNSPSEEENKAPSLGQPVDSPLPTYQELPTNSLPSINKDSNEANIPTIDLANPSSDKTESVNKEPPSGIPAGIPKDYHNHPEQPVKEELHKPKDEFKHPRKAKIRNLNSKQIANEERTPETVAPIETNDELKGTLNEASIQDSFVDSSVLDDREPLEYCQANSIKTIPEEPSFYIVALRTVLGKFVDLFPDGVVLFLELTLKISVKLLMFVFLIGLLWIVLFIVKLFHISISNETVLKNYLCESQSKVSLIQRERDELRNKLNAQNLKLTKGLEEQRHEVDQLVNRLNADNKQLKESRSTVEKELEEQLNLVKSLRARIDQLNENNSILFKENDELNEQMNEELAAKDELKNKLNQLDELNKELIVKDEQTEKQINEYRLKIDNLNEQLDEQRKLTSEKEIEIGCLNKMLDELKHSNELVKESNDDESDSTEQNEETNATGTTAGSFYDIVKLRCEIEKLEKERNDSRDKLNVSLEKIDVLESKLEKLEQESSQYNEIKSKAVKEKEQAEKYLDFLKKYHNENKNELQKELGVYQYKEKQLAEENKELQSKIEVLEKKVDENEQKYQAAKKEFEEMEKQLRDDLLTSNKSACDYFKSAQALKAELTSVKKDAEYLRQQLRNPSASSSRSQSQAAAILPPPEMPKAVLEFFGQLSSGQIAAAANATGLPNLNNLNSLNDLSNVSNSNFITAPSPIQPPQSLAYDYQQAANYHSSFSNLPFTSQQSQPTSMLNNLVPTSNSNFHQPMIDPMFGATSSAADPYAQQQQQQDYQYASLPNIPYSNQQQVDHRFNTSILAQQQNWNAINNSSYTPSNQGDTTSSNSPHPSLYNNI